MDDGGCGATGDDGAGGECSGVRMSGLLDAELCQGSTKRPRAEEIASTTLAAAIGGEEEDDDEAREDAELQRKLDERKRAREQRKKLKFAGGDPTLITQRAPGFDQGSDAPSETFARTSFLSSAVRYRAIQRLDEFWRVYKVDDGSAASPVFGLPNATGSACFAIAPVQTLAAAKSVLELVRSLLGMNKGRLSSSLSDPELLAQCLASGIVAVTQRSATVRRAAVLCLDAAHRAISDQAGRQDDAGFFADKAFELLGLPRPRLLRTFTCRACKETSEDDGESAHRGHPAVWHIESSCGSIEVGLARSMHGEVRKQCGRCKVGVGVGRPTHDWTLGIREPELAKVVAIVVDRVDFDLEAQRRVKHTRPVSFPLTLSDVGLGPTRRLVGTVGHSGDDTGEGGHCIATARRFWAVSRPVASVDHATIVPVGANGLLRFDDGNAPEPVELQDMANFERVAQTIVLLYELAPDGYEQESDVPEPEPLQSRLLPRVPGIGAAISEPAILKEPVLFRGDASRGLPTHLRLEKARGIITTILRDLIAREGSESVFFAEPEYVLRGRGIAGEGKAGESSIIHGQCQLGKTDVTLLLAWISHFVYDTVPIIVVKSAGGAESISQFSSAVNDFNNRICKIVEARAPSEDIAYVERFYLLPVARAGEVDGSHLADLDETRFQEGRAQVVFRLLNATNVSVYLKAGRGGRSPRKGDLRFAVTWYDELNKANKLWHKQARSEGRARVTLLFDEGDMTVTSSSRQENRIERELFAVGVTNALREWSLVHSVHHCVFITATPATLFFTARPQALVRVVELPIKADYYGFSAHVPEERRIWLGNGSVSRTPEDARVPKFDGSYLEAHPGIRQMADSMLADTTRRRVALVNAEARLIGQHGIQDELLELARDRGFTGGVFTIAHNGGNADSVLDDFKYGCSIKSFGISDDVLRQFVQPETEADGTTVFPWSLKLELLRGRRGEVRFTRVSGTSVGFRRGMDIRAILSMLDRAIQVTQCASGRWPLLFIVTGAMGGRGISYKSSNHEMHLTDEYLYIHYKSSRQHTSIQLASRICGRYNVQVNPHLRLWCSETTWRLICGMVELEDKIVDVARRAYSDREPVVAALKETTFPSYEHIEHLRQLRIASQRVMLHWTCKSSRRLPDSTILARSTCNYWELHLNCFMMAEADEEAGTSPRPDYPVGSGEGDAVRVAGWTPDVIVRRALHCKMIDGIMLVRLNNVATELVECVLSDDESSRLEILRDNHVELRKVAIEILASRGDSVAVTADAGVDKGGTIFARSNASLRSYCMCPSDYATSAASHTARDFADRLCRFVPRTTDQPGRIWIIRRLRSHAQIRSVPYDGGVRVILWHRFKTTADDNGFEQPTVLLQARLEFDPDPDVDLSRARSFVDSAANKTTWKPVSRDATSDIDDDDDDSDENAGGLPPRGVPQTDMATRDHFTTLGLMPGASQIAIRKAYLALARKIHPDKGGDEIKYMRIRNAYDALYENEVPSGDDFSSDFEAGKVSRAGDNDRDGVPPPYVDGTPEATQDQGRPVMAPFGAAQGTGVLSREDDDVRAPDRGFGIGHTLQELQKELSEDFNASLRDGGSESDDGFVFDDVEPSALRERLPARAVAMAPQNSAASPVVLMSPARSTSAPVIAPPATPADIAVARVQKLTEERTALVDRLLKSLYEGFDPSEGDGRMHFPSPAAMELNEELNNIDTAIRRDIKKYCLEDVDTELDLVGRPGFLQIGDIVYAPDGRACEVLSASLGRSAKLTRDAVIYTVGKPARSGLPFGVESMSGRRTLELPSSSLTRERPSVADPDVGRRKGL